MRNEGYDRAGLLKRGEMKRKLKTDRAREQWTTVERLNYVLSGWLPERLTEVQRQILLERVADFAEWEVGACESAYLEGYLDAILKTSADSMEAKLEAYLERKYGCLPNQQRTAVSVQSKTTKTEGSDSNAGKQ